MVIVACEGTSELYEVLVDSGIEFATVESLDEALGYAKAGDGVLALSDSYPVAELDVTADQLNLARWKNVRLFVEYPRSVPGVELGEPQPTQWERVVISSDFFAPDLERGEILALHGCWFLPASASNVHMVVARVAGYHKAVYGLPPGSRPILMEMPDHGALIATSCLSRFVTARYGPTSAWKAIWRAILRWAAPSVTVPPLTWEPTVATAFRPDATLPDDAERGAFERSMEWFRNEVVYSIDWKKGAIEGFESGIDYRGRQKRRTWGRGDCTGETGMVFALDWAVNRNPESKRLAGQILDYVWSSPDFNQAEPDSPAYGLNNWFQGGAVFYGDDNARVIMPTLAAARLMDDDRWDERALRCLVANLRTTGPLGFRSARLDWPASFTEGRSWTYYRDKEVVHYAPHYQAYLWAAFLWAYALTGYEGFLTRTVNAIRMTMETYPRWRWTNGFSQELARMLLPLAFLVRIDDTAEHREWLDRIAGDLLELMQPCGAIRERFGAMEDGSYPSPRSNKGYGTSEASLIQEDGDPACDLLYTANYALLGLHEAFAATGDGKFKEAQDKLVGFLCRVQVRSEAQPYLDGAWMRGFDYELWEYWGSSADLGWGAWSVESGWTNTWIASVLALRHLNTSLFDLSISERLAARLPSVLEDMLEERGAAQPSAGESPGSRPGSE